jgi:hypothetical protein
MSDPVDVRAGLPGPKPAEIYDSRLRDGAEFIKRLLAYFYLDFTVREDEKQAKQRDQRCRLALSWLDAARDLLAMQRAEGQDEPVTLRITVGGRSVEMMI